MTDQHGSPRSRRPDRSGRGRIVALVFIVALVAGLVVIGQAIVKHNAMQNCLDSGRRDCDARVP